VLLAILSSWYSHATKEKTRKKKRKIREEKHTKLTKHALVTLKKKTKKNSEGCLFKLVLVEAKITFVQKE